MRHYDDLEGYDRLTSSAAPSGGHSPVSRHQEVASFTFLCVVVCLVGFGLVAMYSASYDEALRLGLAPSYFFTRQAVFALMGVACFAIIQYIPINWVKKLTLPLLAASMILMVLTLVTPFGVTRYGSRRWIEIGPLPAFQSSELLRVSAIMFMAWWFSRENIVDHRPMRVLIPVSIVFISAFLIVAQRDYSTTLVFAGIAFAMFLAVGIQFRWMALFLLAGGVPAVVFLLIEPYRVQRLMGFLFPDADPTGLNWQVGNSLKAIASGGLLGKGLGKGSFKLGLLPEVHNDFIFANIIEELGLVGLLAVTTLFFLFAFISYRTYRKLVHEKQFEAYVLFGFTSSIIWQAMINIAVTTGVLPPTGITLPFFSQGGTSLLVVVCECALMYAIIARQKEGLHG